MLSLLAAVLPFIMFQGPYLSEPDVNLTAIREIRCSDGSQGSGFFVAPGIVATARHVTVGSDNETPIDCRDGETGEPFITYHRDKAHDFALMRTNLTVYYMIKYDCKPYTTGKPMSLYGWRPESFRQNYGIPTRNYSDSSFKVNMLGPSPGMREIQGTGAPGMSGGPGIQDGYARGMVNVSSRDNQGKITRMFSYELKDTILCRQNQK